jgi:hypothetical protein
VEKVVSEFPGADTPHLKALLASSVGVPDTPDLKALLASSVLDTPDLKVLLASSASVPDTPERFVDVSEGRTMYSSLKTQQAASFLLS